MSVTTQSGGLLDANTWGGVLPSSGADCIVDSGHIVYLYDQETFICNSLLISGSIITSGNCILDCDVSKRNNSTIGINIASGELIIPNPHVFLQDTTGGTGCLVNYGTTLDIWTATISRLSNTTYRVIDIYGNCIVRSDIPNDYYGDVLYISPSGFCEVFGNIRSQYNQRVTVNGGELIVHGNVSAGSNEQSTVIGVRMNSGTLTIMSGVIADSNGGTCIGVDCRGGTIYSSGDISGKKNRIQDSYKFFNRGFNFEGTGNVTLYSWNDIGDVGKHFIPYWLDNQNATVNLYGFSSISESWVSHDSTVWAGRGTLNWVDQTQYIPSGGKIAIHHHNGNTVNNLTGATVNVSGLKIENSGVFVYSRYKYNGGSSFVPLITDENTYVRNYGQGSAAVFNGSGIKVINRPINSTNINGGANQ